MKRMTLSAILLILLLVVIWSCSRSTSREYKNDLGQTVTDVLFPNENLKSRTTYFNAQRSEYLVVNYHENGMLKDSALYKNGTVEGRRLFFDMEEDLLYEEEYVSGILNGTHRATYSNGVSSFEGYRRNGKMAGSWRFHYPNGQPITYEFYDSAGVLKYFKKYTEQGLPESTTGNGIIFVPALDDGELSGNTIGLSIGIAIPPLYESDLLVSVSAPGSDPVIIFEQAVSVESVNVPFTFDQAGVYTFSFDLTLRFASDPIPEVYSMEKSYTIL